MSSELNKIEYLVYADGSSPFKEWFYGLKDERARAKIHARILRLERGNFGDFKFLGEGVYELRIHYNPGFRIYFGRRNNRTVVIINGGIKKSQRKDIQKAKELWKDYSDEN
ncbi:MAG: type II toxin-antitoxin system RelE/ParE family toxin [Bdellovibrionota bacterium]